MSKGKQQATRPVKAMVGAETSTAAGKGKMTEVEEENDMIDQELDPLMESLKNHNDAFNSLLSLIPAQFYLAPSSEESSTSDNVNSNLTKSKRKQDKNIDAAEKKRQIKEAKRAKLDPDNFKNAAQIQQKRRAIKQASPAQSDEMQLDIGDDLLNGSRAGDTDSEEEEGDGEDDDEADDSSSATQLTSVKGSEESVEKPAVKEIPINGIQDLRARLQAKIQGLQSKRKVPTSSNDGPDVGGDDDSVASTKDELLEERRRKRGEMRDKRRQAVKERRKAEKLKDKKGSNNVGNAKKASSNGTKAPTLLVSDRDYGSNGSMGGRSTEVFVSSDLAFSSLHFGDDENQKGKKNRHALPSDPKAALAILESRKRKEEAREAKRGEQGKDNDAAELERKERGKWSKAEAAAQGVKIRDDESLLKKAAKKKDKIKEKSRKEWSDRERDVKEQVASRQKKRNDNIAARKEKSKKGGKGIGGKKMGGGGKKIKARAGFEGKPRHQSKGQQKTPSRK